MKNFKKLIGDRIYLSPKGTTDEEIEIFTQWVNDFQVTDYIGVTSGICTLAGEKEYLEKMAKDMENRDFNIVDLATDKINQSVTILSHGRFPLYLLTDIFPQKLGTPFKKLFLLLIPPLLS